MIEPKVTSLFLQPFSRDIEATIVSLTEDLLEQVERGWWNDESLRPMFDEPPIDLNWDWREQSIDFEDCELRCERLAIRTGDGVIQGAMMISTEPVPSILEPGEQALFIERLFAAPRNRPALRTDGRDYFKGVGIELFRWGVEFSRKLGFGGRIRLDSSPGALAWYLRAWPEFVASRCGVSSPVDFPLSAFPHGQKIHHAGRVVPIPLHSWPFEP